MQQFQANWVCHTIIDAPCIGASIYFKQIHCVFPKIRATSVVCFIGELQRNDSGNFSGFRATQFSQTFLSETTAHWVFSNRTVTRYRSDGRVHTADIIIGSQEAKLRLPSSITSSAYNETQPPPFILFNKASGKQSSF